MEFWNELDTIRMRWSKPWCIGGDFNVIRFSEDKLGGSRLTPEMSAFSDWINRHGLLDLQLNGASFTWSNHQNPPIMSPMDRFLISGDWAEMYPQASQTALPKTTSDHCPRLLGSRVESWGPKLFRFELMWLEDKAFPFLT